MHMPLYAGVVVEAPLTKVFHYKVPPALRETLRPGSRVVVPFGRTRTQGFCVEVSDTCPVDPDRIKLRELESAGPEGDIVLPEILSLTRWIASYYHTGWGTVLAAAVPAAVRKGSGGRMRLFATLLLSPEQAGEEARRLGGKARRQAAVLELLAELPVGEAVSSVDIQQATGADSGVLRRLEACGFLALHPEYVPPSRTGADLATEAVHLTAEQAHAFACIGQSLGDRVFAPYLLYGITGSGKTEVYLRALEKTLAQGRGVLVLVPEISLTPQTVARFRHRAGDVAVLHSHMADGERAEEWRRLRRGDVRVAVGARSAVFAPLPDLGLIIVDEEHEQTFKQENAPRYHARDVAVMRAREAGAVVVLGSATPSLESWRNAKRGRYTLLTLTTRPGGARPAQAQVVDLKQEWADVKRQTVFSRTLEKAVHECLRRGEQAILFLNRRGFHTCVSCLACGEPLRCESCDISLTLHRKENRLRCHYCDYASTIPTRCPACGHMGLRSTGTGTERVEDLVATLFPEARLLRMDSDTMTGRDAHATALAGFARGDYDLLLGTQMVTKGFDFPNVTLVGVLSADSALNLPDFRASERTFQLITQVVGRAGRADKPGHAVIQAYQPEHPAVQCALRQDFEAFAAGELPDRKSTGYPPYGRLARIIGRGAVEKKVREAMTVCAVALRKVAPSPLAVLGPTPCPLPRLQEEFRYHILLKARTPKEIHAMLAGVELKQTGGVRLAVDVDPLSIL